MLRKGLLSLCVLGALLGGCVLDWDRFQGASPDAGGNGDVPGDLDDVKEAGDVGPRCTPTNDTCPRGQYCAAGVNDCVAGCRADDDCAGQSSPDAGSAPLHCNAPTHTCVPCTADVHCPIGQLCMGNACVPGCGPSRGCPMGLTCCSGGCVDTRVTVAHCGACGSACSVANATPACVGGACVVGQCMPGRGDCDGSAANGCETDVTTTAAHCGACRMACPAPAHAAAVCASGACMMGACEAGYEDCDRGASNGCEVNARTDVMNCGACGNACRFEGAAASCVSGVCVRGRCDAGRGDCDGDPMNGCEIDFTADPANCGRCGNACVVPHATPSCGAGGACAIARCDTGWGDCDGNAANGCETDLTSSVGNCATCGNVCSFPGSGAACMASRCVSTTCATGRGNCDGMEANGCETDTRSNLMHCGACGRACASRPNSTSYCADSACGLTCATGFANCDSQENNGCEVDTRTNVTHCGRCGGGCRPAQATGACVAGACTISRCNAGFDNCDGDVTTGCETDVNTSMAHCGACNRACAPPNARAACTAGACRIQACTGSFGNCDSNDANGCETDMATSNAHCGACGRACAAGRTCVVGRCSVPTFAGYAVGAPPATVTWVDACGVAGHEEVLAEADDEVAIGTLPFPVEFWGGLNHDYLVSANGVVGFGTLFYNINAVPGTGPARSWGAPSTRLAPGAYVFGIDLVTEDGGRVCVATTGAAPNRTWVVMFQNAHLYVSAAGGFGTSTYNFELLAYENSRVIDYLYNAPFTTPFGLTPSSPDPVVVGLQDYRSITSPRTVTYTGTVSPSTRVRFTPM